MWMCCRHPAYQHIPFILHNKFHSIRKTLLLISTHSLSDVQLGKDPLMKLTYLHKRTKTTIVIPKYCTLNFNFRIRHFQPFSVTPSLIQCNDDARLADRRDSLECAWKNEHGDTQREKKQTNINASHPTQICATCTQWKNKFLSLPGSSYVREPGRLYTLPQYKRFKPKKCDVGFLP